MTDPLKEASERVQQQAYRLSEALYRQFPEIKDELSRNMEKYGTPVLHSLRGGLWAEDVPKAVQTILSMNEAPMESSIRPADPEGHHYEVDWHVLTYEDGQLRRAIDVERANQARQ